MRIRRLLQSAIQLMWGELDAVIAPARTGIAPGSISRFPRRPPRPVPPLATREGHRSHRLRFPDPRRNLAGLPALVLPCGFADNLPVAIQLVGPPWVRETLS